MFEQPQLATFDGFAHGQQLIAGCAVRNESGARHAAVTARRIALVTLVLIGLPSAILALARGGVFWIGAIFLIAPACAFAIRTTNGLSARPTAFDAIITEHSLLLIDSGSPGTQPRVAHAYQRLTLADVRSVEGRLIMTSAGSPIKLLTDPADADHMATILRTPPASQTA